MLVSVAAYSLIWGWKFAVGFVLLIFVHEMGHVLQLRREGIKASAPMFIPFFGAVIWAKSLGENAAAEARVGLAGPMLGSLGAAALIPVAYATGNDLFTALAFTGFFLNLFNLLPVVPLDGGRAMAALVAVDVVCRIRRAGGGHDRVPEPDHHRDPAARRHSRRGAAGGSASRPRRAVLQGLAARPGAGRDHVHRADRGCSRSA